MLTNTFISLEPTSKERIDAENIIKYTLLLDYDIPDAAKGSEPNIQSLLDATQNCCYKLFSDKPDTIYYTFFGLPSFPNNDTFTYLDRFPVPSEKTKLPRDASLHRMILQNSVMAAYHAVLTALLHCAPTKSRKENTYSIENPSEAIPQDPQSMETTSTKTVSQTPLPMTIPTYTLYKLQKMGICAMYNHKCISITENRIEWNAGELNKLVPSNPKSSAKASDYHKRLMNRYSINHEFTAFLHDSNDKPAHHFLQFATFCNSLAEILTPELKNLHKNKVETNALSVAEAEALSKSLNSLTKHLTPPISNPALITRPFSDFNNNIVDGMYHYYLAEKVYNHNLFYSLLLNVKHIEKAGFYRFNNKDALDILASCKQLPNPFSRTFFLRYAFDHIDNQSSSYQDFWHNHNYDRNAIFSSRTRKSFTKFHFDRWLHQFGQFVTYMSDHIIPIYNWCFITMLLHTIEENFSDKTHIFHLKKALEYLAEYIKENYQNILQPIRIEADKEMSGLDIITPKKVNFSDFSFMEMEELRSLFFSSTEGELNLKTLNRDSFKPKREDSPNAIQDFYLKTRFDFILQ